MHTYLISKVRYVRQIHMYIYIFYIRYKKNIKPIVSIRQEFQEIKKVKLKYFLKYAEYVGFFLLIQQQRKLTTFMRKQ